MVDERAAFFSLCENSSPDALGGAAMTDSECMLDGGWEGRGSKRGRGARLRAEMRRSEEGADGSGWWRRLEVAVAGREGTRSGKRRRGWAPTFYTEQACGWKTARSGGGFGCSFGCERACVAPAGSVWGLAGGAAAGRAVWRLPLFRVQHIARPDPGRWPLSAPPPRRPGMRALCRIPPANASNQQHTRSCPPAPASVPFATSPSPASPGQHACRLYADLLDHCLRPIAVQTIQISGLAGSLSHGASCISSSSACSLPSPDLDVSRRPVLAARSVSCRPVALARVTRHSTLGTG